VRLETISERLLRERDQLIADSRKLEERILANPHLSNEEIRKELRSLRRRVDRFLKRLEVPA